MVLRSLHSFISLTTNGVEYSYGGKLAHERPRAIQPLSRADTNLKEQHPVPRICGTPYLKLGNRDGITIEKALINVNVGCASRSLPVRLRDCHRGTACRTIEPSSGF